MNSKSAASAKKEDESAKDNSEGPADQANTPSNKRKLSTTDVTSKSPKMEPSGMNDSSRGSDSAHKEQIILRGKRSMPSDESTEQVLNASTSSSKENTPTRKVRKVKSHDNNEDMDDPESEAAVADKGKRPYKCTECQKSFAFKSCLRNHCASHTGEHLVQCHICYKVISYQQHLNAHMKIQHSGSISSPVVSNVTPAAKNGHMICFYPSCGKEIPRKEMQNHVWDHEVLSGAKPYKCSDCPKSFENKLRLGKHSVIHTGELVVQCPYCDKSASHKGNLEKHIKSMHPAETGHSSTRSKTNPKRTGQRKKNKIGINDANSSESKADECAGSSSLDSNHVDQQQSASSHVTPVRRVQRQCRERNGTSVVGRQLRNRLFPENLDIRDFPLPKENFNKPDIKLTQSKVKLNDSQDIAADSHVSGVELRVTVQDKEKTGNPDELKGGPGLGVTLPITCSTDDVNNIIKTEEDGVKLESLKTVMPVGAKPANGILKKQNEPNVTNMGEVSNDPNLEDINKNFDLPNGKLDKNKDDRRGMVESNTKKQLDEPSGGNKNKFAAGPKTVLGTSAEDIVLIHESKPPTEESQNVHYDNFSIRSGPVFRERYPDVFSSEISDGTASDVYQAAPEHVDCATQQETIDKDSPIRPKIKSMEGSSQYTIEKYAKSNIDTIYVVWHKQFSLDIARSVEANSSNTMLIVEKLDSRQEFELVKLFRSFSHNHIYVGDEGQHKLHCFLFGSELLAHRSDTKLFPNFEEVERELTTFASSYNKSLVHIIEQEWVISLMEQFKKLIILSRNSV